MESRDHQSRKYGILVPISSTSLCRCRCGFHKQQASRGCKARAVSEQWVFRGSLGLASPVNLLESADSRSLSQTYSIVVFVAGGWPRERLKQTQLWDLKSWVISKTFHSAITFCDSPRQKNTQDRGICPHYPLLLQPHFNLTSSGSFTVSPCNPGAPLQSQQLQERTLSPQGPWKAVSRLT